MFSATVADELALESMLDAMPPLQRASIERALDSRETHNFGLFDEMEIEEAEQRGYARGFAAGKVAAKGEKSA
jgi:hypothetical protein